MTDDRNLESIAELLADATARTIIVETNREPLSASELESRCGVSEPTVYRRLEQLREHDLVEPRTRPDPDGHHHDVYVAMLDRVVVDLLDDGFEVEVTRPEPMADRFTRLVERM